jgi:predicted ATP-binding protein involved in virulence
MFQNFTLNLVGTDNKPLPLIVLAGKNGTGKTSILEYLSDYNLNEGDFIEIFKTKKAEGIDAFIDDNEIIVESFKLLKTMEGIILKKRAEYKNHILYLPVQIGDTGNVEEKIAEHYKKKAKEYDSFKKSLAEVQNYMDTIFQDLELTFKIDDIDDDKKKVSFKNSNGEIFGAEALSTGEKTLLSKVLYLYFGEFKNKIILIDEPELSLHPAWQNRVLKLYESFAIKNNCQIIIATHSPHIIGSAKNESIRVLQKNREGKMEALDHFSQSYGLEFHKILTEIMGVEYLRTPEVAEKLATIKKMIAQNHFDTSEFQEKWQELEEIFGDNYLDLKLLKLEIASRKKSV